MAKNPQPAKKSYFFDKGYRDLGHTIKGAWSRNTASIKKYAGNFEKNRYKPTIAKIFLGILNVFAIIAVVICGSLVTAAITALNVAVLLIFMLIVYIGFSAVWLADRIYLMKNKIFTACHECKQKSLIPVYLCPRCGAKHDNLTPGVYGILKRTCNCGEKLPTAFFNGRKELSAECPCCHHPLTDRETRPLCIPIVGGRSVGKTAFITAFSKEFFDRVAPEKGLTVEFYNEKKAQIYHQITTDFSTGSTRMTERSQDINTASSVSFSFFVKNSALVPDRLFHVYDIAGEVFTDNSENEVQQQYEYCQGMVMIIDPLSIPSFYNSMEQTLAPEDVAGAGKADINGIVDSFINKLREVTGLSDNKMSSVPLAIVISKTDAAELDKVIGRSAVERLMREQPEKFTDYFDAQDYLCRKFLRDNGMESFLSIVTMRFKNNRFFACSAIGHARDKGRYVPQGVLEPMEWIVQNADSKLGAIWHDNTFTKKPQFANEP